MVISLSGWFWNKTKKEEPVVVGIWKSADDRPAVLLNFDSDGNYKADIVNSESDIVGYYSVLADKVIFSEGQMSLDRYCQDNAYYYFKVSQNYLRLMLIADSCAPRRALLSGEWELVPKATQDVRKNKRN